MPSKQQQQVGAQLDGRAAALTLRDVLTHYALLERAITRANLWHELAWDGAGCAARCGAGYGRVGPAGGGVGNDHATALPN